MRKKEPWKAELENAFACPKPAGKQAFLENLKQGEAPPESPAQWMLGQAAYIQKSTWILSAAAFLAAWAAGAVCRQQGNTQGLLWSFAAMVPFLILFAAGELVKADLYGMRELERSARFSSEKILSTKLVLLGSFDGVLFLPAFFLSVLWGSWSALRIFFLLFLPYMTAAFVCLGILLLVSGQTALWYCLAASIGISCSSFAVIRSTWMEHFPLYWLFLAAGLLLAGVAAEISRLKRKEGIIHDEAYC